MALDGEDLILRQRVCLDADCRALFWLCRRCDRGQRYCSLVCRAKARRRQRRAANRRHQQSPEGRLDHRDRQRAWRRRLQTRVTDQGSVPVVCPASSGCEEKSVLAVRARCALAPAAPEPKPVLPPRCRVCGRPGRFIDPFPRFPRRW